MPPPHPQELGPEEQDPAKSLLWRQGQGNARSSSHSQVKGSDSSQCAAGYLHFGSYKKKVPDVLSSRNSAGIFPHVSCVGTLPLHVPAFDLCGSTHIKMGLSFHFHQRPTRIFWTGLPLMPHIKSGEIFLIHVY